MSELPLRRALVEWLRSAGVEYLFGNPGSSEVPLLDALVGVERPRYVLVAHEAVAIAMADGYAQLSGRPGVVSVHVTPGLTNVLGGLFLARAHRSPVVVLVGQQDSRLLARRPFLASDLVETARQHTKWAWQVSRADELLPALRRAFELAVQPPAGPVVLAIPKDLPDHLVDAALPPAPAPAAELGVPPGAALEAAAAIVASARAPLLLSGNGVGARGAPAIAAVVALAETIGARVHSEHNATNMHFPGGHPQYLGGNAHGTREMRPLLASADVLIAVGCDLFMEDRYDPEPLIPPGCRIVQIDEDPSEIGRLYPVAAGLAGDLAATVDALAARVREAAGPGGARDAARRRAEVAGLRAAIDARRAHLRAETWARRPIRMPRVYAELRAAMPDDAVMVDEAINMASYLHDSFELRLPGTLLSSKQGWLGWGWGAALGAQLARPERRVVACLGDGSATYALQALWTANRYGLPVVSVILNNGGYVAVQNHLRNYGGSALARREYVGTDLGGIDFVGLAQAFGVAAERVEDPDGLRPAFDRALAAGAPRLVEVALDRDDAGSGREPIPRAGR